MLGCVTTVAALLAALVIGRSLGSGVVMVGVAGLLLILMYGIAAATLRNYPFGPARTLTIGVCAGITLVVVTVAAWAIASGFDPFAMTKGQINDALKQWSSHQREAFYPGEEVAGLHLEEVSVLEPDGVLFFEYGRCLDHDEGGCTHPLTVTNQPTGSFGSRGEITRGCKRLPPVLGVPAARVHGDLMVFTHSSIVTLTYFKVIETGYGGYTVDPARQVKMAAHLRAVGQPDATKALPPPDAATRAFVRQHCGRSP